MLNHPTDKMIQMCNALDSDIEEFHWSSERALSCVDIISYNRSWWMLSFLNKYPSSSSQHQLRARAVRAAQRCNKGSSEVLWVRWCENIQLNRFHDKNHLPGLKGAAHLTDCSSKPKLLTGQRKLCLFWPTFSHGVAGLSDFLLQKQYGLFKGNKARLGG